MPKPIRQFQKLKADVEQKREELNRAEGGLEQIKKELAETYRCPSIPRARKLLDKLQKKETELEEQLATALNKLERKWKAKL